MNTFPVPLSVGSHRALCTSILTASCVALRTWDTTNIWQTFQWKDWHNLCETYIIWFEISPWKRKDWQKLFMMFLPILFPQVQCRRLMEQPLHDPLETFFPFSLNVQIQYCLQSFLIFTDFLKYHSIFRYWTVVKIIHQPFWTVLVNIPHLSNIPIF